MKLICNCGNEHEFIKEILPYEEDDECQGEYVKCPRNFDLWEIHDAVGIKCCKCGEAIWMFV